MSTDDLSPIQFVAALAEQIYHRNANDDPITLGQLGATSIDLNEVDGLTSSTTDANGTAYYSP